MSSQAGARFTKNVLLVGSPNSGKTTLFNKLTGLSAKTVNYPGSTVDLLVGSWTGSGNSIQVFDTPGIYSLQPRSPDEEITIAALKTKEPHAVVAVVDATLLSRQLAIAIQLKRLFTNAKGLGSVVIAVTMLDLLKTEGEGLDLKRLSEELGMRVIATDSEEGVAELRRAIEMETPSAPLEISQVESFHIATDLKESKRIKDLVLISATGGLKDSAKSSGARAITRRIDQTVLHPVLGPALFFAVMTTLFILIYWLAAPLMDFIDSGFSSLVDGLHALPGVDPENLMVRLFSDGLIAGLGAVFVFVPQIFILFAGLVFLEDSGYLARAATIVDRPLKALGLGGRSFVPLLSGFACAVPAMMAARTVSSRKERMLTLFVIPLMSCSARLPVYALLLALLFGDDAIKAGLMLGGLYFGSIVSGVIAAGVLSRFAEKRGLFGKEKSFLLLELPLYRRPSLGLVFKQAFMRTKSYIKRTGPVILVLSIVIWAGTNFPQWQLEDPTARLEQSFAGQIGKYVSPIFEPMGGDWRTGLGLMSAFAAREVFVSTLAVIFHVTEVAEEGSMQTGLLTALREAKTADGDPLFTVASSLGLMLFFMIAMQCLATFATAAREGGSYKFAVIQLIVFNIVAYVLTVMLVQGLRAVGIA